ncbi:MAG: protease inhibitor I42 family protein [Treponema sp.]|nr:protease inhibitor I42 family protein [Treponema sp.]
MKKIFGVFLAILLITGCAHKKMIENSEKLDFIELIGNPTTGYSWIAEIEDESVLMLEEYVTYLGEEKIVGAPSSFVYKIVPLKQGSTTVLFKYMRPWEKNAPIETKLYNIEVDAQEKIKITLVTE